MAWSAEKAKTAVKSLSRIRAAESPPDARGIKTVWHQGAEGADLVSYVDSAGVVVEQTLTLLSDHFVWTAKVGLKSGNVGPAEGSKAAVASDAVMLDRALSSERVIRAADALKTYEGGDKYIQHIRGLLLRAGEGMQSYDGEQVTGFIAPGDAKRMQREIAEDARRKKQRKVIAIAAGVGVLLFLLGAVLMIAR